MIHHTFKSLNLIIIVQNEMHNFSKKLSV